MLLLFFRSRLVMSGLLYSVLTLKSSYHVLLFWFRLELHWIYRLLYGELFLILSLSMHEQGIFKEYVCIFRPSLILFNKILMFLSVKIFSVCFDRFILFVRLFCFLGVWVWHMKVPRLGVESELQLPSYNAATAMLEPSHVCNLHHSSCQCWILNPLNGAKNWTHVIMDTSQVHFYWTTIGTLIGIFYFLFLLCFWFLGQGANLDYISDNHRPPGNSCIFYFSMIFDVPFYKISLLGHLLLLYRNVFDFWCNYILSKYFPTSH